MNNLLTKKLKTILPAIVVLITIVTTQKSYSQINLYAGDVAFTAYNCGSNANDTFAIILLKNIDASTEIIFTDGLYTDASGYFVFPAAATSDWAFRWVSGVSLNLGTQIKFWTSTTNCSGNCGYNASVGSITWGRGLSLPSSGDQIFACQGGTIDTTSSTRKYTPGRVLAGIHMNLTSATTVGNWDVGQTGTSASELPDSLTTYTNAIWHKYIGTGVSGEVDNVRYKCTVTSGTASAIRSATMDTTNWTYLDGTATSFSPASCADVPTVWNGSTWSNGTPSQNSIAAIGSSTTPGAFSADDLYINSGFTLTLSSGVTATIYGDLYNNGSGTSGTGTLRFAGTAQSLNTNAFTHSGPVEVATGSTLTTNSKLTMANNASLMHGTSTTNGGGSVSGSITFQKTIGSTTKGWRMFALPVDDLIENFETGLNTLCSNHSTAAERNVYYWDPTAAGAAPGGGNYATGWTQANGTSDDDQKAYSIYLDNTSSGIWDFSGTVSITGTPNDGSRTFNLGYTWDPAGTGSGSATQRGWNMIPNYFPSVLSIYNLINDANFGTTYKAIHIWDQGTSQMKGVNQSSLNNYNTNGGGGFLSSIHQLSPFTAFWVKATSTSQSIQLKNSMRVTRTDSIPANTYFKKAFDIFRVTVKDADGKFDQFSVCFDEAATDGMDYTMDIYKFKSFSDEVPTLYTMVEGDMISLNALPVKTSYSIPLYMESFKNGKEYTFNPEMEEYSNLFDVELVDNKTGAKTQLLSTNYTFKHDDKYKGPRFTLNFTQKSTTSVDELFSHEKMWAYTGADGINVVYANNNTDARATVELYNVMGQKLFTTQNVLPGETINFKPVKENSANVYVARVISNGKSKSIKVVY